MNSEAKILPSNHVQPLRAAVGDLIQYRYRRGAFDGRSVRRVIKVREDGDFVVEGGFWVRARDIYTVIPMHEEITETESAK